MPSTVSSFGKTSSVKGKRYSYLPAQSPSVMVSRSASVFSRPLPLAVTSPLRQIALSRHGRVLRQSRGVTVDSGLQRCVNDDPLQACVLITTEGDNSRIRLSSSQDCQHVLSTDIKPYNKNLLGTSSSLLYRPTLQMLHNVSTLVPDSCLVLCLDSVTQSYNNGSQSEYKQGHIVTVLPLCDKFSRGVCPMTPHTVTRRVHIDDKLLGSPKEGHG
jgi:hypothetical protein